MNILAKKIMKLCGLRLISDNAAHDRDLNSQALQVPQLLKIIH
jgi:hypothetical protein